MYVQELVPKCLWALKYFFFTISGPQATQIHFGIRMVVCTPRVTPRVLTMTTKFEFAF